jgi:branched-chain amino acid transport system ATP-binding protein
MNPATLLRVENLQAYYGKSHVLHGVDLTVGRSEIVSLLGRNGVGRSTTAKAIMGLVDCTGTVEFNGQDLTRLKTYEIAHLGVGYVPENRDIFPTLTVEENLRLGVKGRRPGRWNYDDMYRLFPRLAERSKTEAGVLSGGEQQMLTLGRALSTQPRLLLVDELSLGLAPLIVARLLRAVRAAADAGVGVLLVEQHAGEAMSIADRAVVLRHGRVELAGSAAELRDHLTEIEAAYLTGVGKD